MGITGIREIERMPRRIIYCIEGVHQYGGETDPTVEPMLELLQRLGSWEYLHRTCATADELESRLGTEWNAECDFGSVLYFFTHGGPDQIWLRPDGGAVGVLTMKEWLDCRGCHIHFSGCDTFRQGTRNLQTLMEDTEAVSVSGYAAMSDWLDPTAPALALELQLLWSLKAVGLERDYQGRRSERLADIKASIAERYRELKFHMLVR